MGLNSYKMQRKNMEGDFMLDTNFSLLSQEEIDTLIEFLTASSDTLECEVLSQESIDKLISMMKLYGKKPSGNHNVLGDVRVASSVMGETGGWILEFEENADTGFMDLFATNGEDKEYITPRGYSCKCFVADESAWGYAISPVQFADIAKAYNLKFSKSVFMGVCQRFAEKNYGDASYDVDDFFMAPSKDVLACLL